MCNFKVIGNRTLAYFKTLTYFVDLVKLKTLFYFRITISRDVSKKQFLQTFLSIFREKTLLWLCLINVESIEPIRIYHNNATYNFFIPFFEIITVDLTLSNHYTTSRKDEWLEQYFCNQIIVCLLWKILEW